MDTKTILARKRVYTFFTDNGWHIFPPGPHGSGGDCHLVTRPNLPSREEAWLSEDGTKFWSPYPSTEFDLTDEGERLLAGKIICAHDTPTGPELALAFIGTYGGIDGGHHKQWVLDQVVRALTNCPVAPHTSESGYTHWEQGESPEYLAWVADGQGEYDPEEEEYEYSWDTGIAP